MDTVNWLYDEVMATGYYDVYLQEQVSSQFKAPSKEISAVTPPDRYILGQTRTRPWASTASNTMWIVRLMDQMVTSLRLSLLSTILVATSWVSTSFHHQGGPCWCSEQTDYPSTVTGNVALISRGTCPFGNKVALAGAAGAAGAIIYSKPSWVVLKTGPQIDNYF